MQARVTIKEQFEDRSQFCRNVWSFAHRKMHSHLDSSKGGLQHHQMGRWGGKGGARRCRICRTMWCACCCFFWKREEMQNICFHMFLLCVCPAFVVCMNGALCIVSGLAHAHFFCYSFAHDALLLCSVALICMLCRLHESCQVLRRLQI